MNKQIQHLQDKWEREQRQGFVANAKMLSGVLVELSEAIESGDFLEAKYAIEEIDSETAKLREYVTKKLASR